MQPSSVISLSPSFNSYSNTKIAEIAARVVEEFVSEEFYQEFYFDDSEIVETERGNNDALNDDDGEGEFEFAFVNTEFEFPSPISADEIFQNGQIRPVYPLFNRSLFLDCMEFQKKNENGEKPVANFDSEKSVPVRLPLKTLFIEERESSMTMRTTTTSSCSSSEADDLEGLPAESYCVWRPAAEGQCKKSSSAGSNSKRWKFKDLLHRSNSDGIKGSFVILSLTNSGRKKQSEQMGNEAAVKDGKGKSSAAPPRVHNRDSGAKRRSFLPYRRDLVGLFGNINMNA